VEKLEEDNRELKEKLGNIEIRLNKDSCNSSLKKSLVVNLKKESNKKPAGSLNTDEASFKN